MLGGGDATVNLHGPRGGRSVRVEAERAVDDEFSRVERRDVAGGALVEVQVVARAIAAGSVCAALRLAVARLVTAAAAAVGHTVLEANAFFEGQTDLLTLRHRLVVEQLNVLVVDAGPFGAIPRHLPRRWRDGESAEVGIHQVCTVRVPLCITPG